MVVNRYPKIQFIIYGPTSLLLCLAIAACAQFSEQSKHNLIKNSSVNTQTPVETGKSIELSGLWKFGYRYQGKSVLANMQILQADKNFSGQGKEEQTGRTFKISQGKIKGDEVLFVVRYDSNPQQVIQYHGHLSSLQSENGGIPYMGGDFSFESNGGINVGEWEAAKAEAKPNIPSTVPQQSQTNANEDNKKPEGGKFSQTNENHAPDLSGKWNVAYEYNFKTEHSIMFLEQYGHKITGHGVDSDTKQKFVIKKGWYDFPNLTIIREYADKSHRPEPMIFKAEVSEVHDADYSGPYLSGKTQGGGEWEAERVN